MTGAAAGPRRRTDPRWVLAERLGIVTEFVDNDGRRCVTSDRTAERLLAAMGWDASTERTAAAALRRLEDEERGRLLAPLAASLAGGAVTATVRPPPGAVGDGHCRATVRDESVEEWHVERPVAVGSDGGPFAVPLSGCDEPGYYDLAVELEVGGARYEGRQRLVVTPGRCAPAPVGASGAFGIWANLYSVRSDRNWGVGDLTDLMTLVRWSAEVGAAFVGVNPLHALPNRDHATSPYSPVSRLFRNPLYLDVEAVPELGQCAAARARLASRPFAEELIRLRAAGRLDYEAVMALKRPVLELLHRTFAEGTREADTERGRAYRSFRARSGAELDDFATFAALSDELAARADLGDDGRDWRRWPADLSDPRSESVSAFRRARREQVDFHAWLQFELDRQLASVGRAARGAGHTIGLYQDLAIGVPATACDPWAHPDLFARGVRLGCPPDAFSRAGQDWELTPLDPHRLADDGARYWTGVLRAAFAHSGALRIDHVMGLQRQYWIPEGEPPSEGAYVRYPERELLAVLALESRRHGAVVVGEDLGTVPRSLPPTLARWGILSSRVASFERDRRGAFKPSRSYSRRALVTANTHDLPPLAALLGRGDLARRRALGQLADDEALETAVRDREAELAALVRRLVREGELDDEETPTREALLVAVHGFLARTPSPLVGVSLDDLLGEDEPVNIPGVSPAVHASWARRMSRCLEELRDDPLVARVVERFGARRARGT